VRDGILAAQTSAEGSSLRIAILGVNHEGKLFWRSDPVTFPDWVSVGPAPGCSFEAEGRIDEGDLVLKWEARANLSSGSLHTGREKVESGIARISLKTGTLSMLPPEKPAAIPAVRLPKGLTSYSLGSWPGVWTRQEPVISGDLLVAVEWQQTGEAAPPRKEATAKEELSRLVLWRWKLPDGDPLEPVELCKGVSCSVILLPQESYLLVSPGVRESTVADHHLDVCSIRTGERVGLFPDAGSMRAVTIVGTRGCAVYEQPLVRGPSGQFTAPRTVRVIDVTSGRELWERAIAGRLWLTTTR
jgi:hypothetical protein